MITEEVTADYYQQIVKSPYYIFGSAAFNRLNEQKTNKVAYILFKNPKYRLAIVGGVSDRTFASPFSAPFGGFIPLADDTRLQYIEQAVDALEVWAKDNHIERIKFTFPPFLYQETFISRVINVLYRKAYSIRNVELNHHFDLSKFTDHYVESIWHNARKNLRIALTNNLSFRLCAGDVQKQEAYDIIRQNRQERGFPLHMSWEQVNRTAQVVPADFFVVTDAGHTLIAAAIIFATGKETVQVIYWGDIPKFAHLKTMNFLSYKVFEYYKGNNFRFVDIGHSTDNSVPNYGLCEFKESIGCDVSDKFTFIKEI